MACAWASVVMIEIERIWLVLKHPQAQYCSMSTYLALASACIPAPNNPTIFNKGLGITPQGKLSCSVLPFAVLYKMNFSRQATAEMGWCRVVGPRGLCRPLDVKQGFPTLRDRDWTEAGLQTCGCPGLAQEARAPGIYQPPPQKNSGLNVSSFFTAYRLREVNGGVVTTVLDNRLQHPPFWRDARLGASVRASRAHANGIKWSAALSAV